MKSISLEINKNQFIKMINTLDDTDKFAIYRELKKSLFLKRFNKLLKSTRTSELSFEDITKEVEYVRKKRHEQGKQIS